MVLLASKLWTSVRNDFQGKAMIAEHMLNEQVSPSLAVHCVVVGTMYTYLVNLSTKTRIASKPALVYKDKNSVIACLGLRKTCDKVGRDIVPRTVWNEQRLQ